jgi:hypothetical protein
MNIRGGSFTIPFGGGLHSESCSINLNIEAGLFWLTLDDKTQIDIPINLVRVLHNKLIEELRKNG